MKITIPGIPIAKGRPRVGKFGIYTPTKTVNYENLVQFCYMDQAEGIKLSGPLGMYIALYFPIPKSYTKKQIEFIKAQSMVYTKKPDLDNVIKCITDSLNHFAYDDDSQIVEMRALKRYTVDEPRAEVVIWEALDNE